MAPLDNPSRKKRRIFSQLKKKFQLAIINESTLESVFSLRVSRLDGIFLVASLLVVFFFLSMLLIKYTGLGTFVPQAMNTEQHQQLLAEAYRVDSLKKVIEKQAAYLTVVKQIIAGEVPADLTDEAGRSIPIDTMVNRHLELLKTSKAEQAFRKEYEEAERYNLSTLEEQEAQPVLLFYPPVKGEILSAYNPNLHRYGLDLKVKDRQSVLSILPGTVIYAGYSPEYQYVICVQHTNGFLSFYKYNAELLKKQGDRVKAGEAIAMGGQQVTGKGSPHLYFEIWQDGVPQNPTEYISFTY
jgi:murein DD-endopeptidase MepM/ murein hydrolase activator NlpD